MTAVSDAGDGGEAGVSEAGVRDAHHQGGRAGAKIECRTVAESDELLRVSR